MPESRVAFPQGRQFAMTWSIPEQFGGMTSALLHRSRAFVRLGGVPVEVLTFDPKLDIPATERRLRESGELIDGVRLLNLYDWIRNTVIRPDAPGSLDLERHPLTPLSGDDVRMAEDGTLLQADYRRTDGTLALSDRRDVREPGTLGGRSIVLCDANGVPLRSWGRIWSLYRFWLDELRRGEGQRRAPSFFIVDSKTMAPFAMTYRRKRAVMLHQVHASHLSGTDPAGPLRETRRAVFEQLDGFDSVVLLTRRQRDDVLARSGNVQNLAVIPNSRELTARRPAPRVHVGHGIVLASLTGRKRVDHAIRAVALASSSLAGITLDVFGDGDARPSLERLIADLPETGATVQLRGYRPDAREQFASASYLLQTAQSEGFPLVLVEAMAAGCIPICYDVPYGPADVVVHGRTGFLVPPGDVEALAGAIVRLGRMAPWRVARMRRAAKRAARRFSDLEVTRAWAREQRLAEQRKLAAWPQRLTA